MLMAVSESEKYLRNLILVSALFVVLVILTLIAIIWHALKRGKKKEEERQAELEEIAREKDPLIREMKLNNFYSKLTANELSDIKAQLFVRRF